MLVAISDLHFADNPAGGGIDRNVSKGAFDLWREEVVHYATKRNATEIVLLYLGDMLDLLRSEAWFKEKLEDRPWGDASINDHPSQITGRCGACAREILDGIERSARPQLDVLAGVGWNVTVPVKRVFVAGNHDRLYRVDPGVRARVDQLLSVTTTSPNSVPDVYRNADYGVVARHGHEFDVWNFSAGAKTRGGDYALSQNDYLQVPIGDPITTELVTRVPYVVRGELQRQGIDPAIVTQVYRRLLDIENVRPLYAAVGWIFYATQQMSAQAPWKKAVVDKVREVIESSLRGVFDAFMAIPFVTRWIELNDSWKNPFDEADKLQILHALARAGVSLKRVEPMVKALERFRGGEEEHSLIGADREPTLNDAQFHYAVYGHTHRFDQVALRVHAGHEKLYANTGTWRPRYHAARNGADFVEWKEMSWLVFYNAEEQRNGAPAFESWTGTRFEER